MLQVAMLLCSVPAGRYCRSAARALVVLGAIFVAVLILQSIVVGNSAKDGLPLAYWLVQAATLAAAALLLCLGVGLRARRLRATPLTSPSRERTT